MKEKYIIITEDEFFKLMAQSYVDGKNDGNDTWVCPEPIELPDDKEILEISMDEGCDSKSVVFFQSGMKKMRELILKGKQ